MLLVDDLLLGPARGLLWIFRKIQEAAQEELVHEAEAVTASLSDLHMLLETGKLSEAEFEARERVLLDRLDALREQGAEAGEDDAGEDAADDGGTDD